MRVLGAIIAGGTSSRFGTDKALALVAGRPLIAHVADRLAAQCTTVLCCGRAWPDIARLPLLDRLDDRPAPGLGPLGGLCAALTHAAAAGYDAVLAAPVDVHPLPYDCVARLAGTGPAVFARQHLIGLWPVGPGPNSGPNPGRLGNRSGAAALDRFIADGGRAVHRWIAVSGARLVADPPGLSNINRPDDLP